jgi:hypothetical protein
MGKLEITNCDFKLGRLKTSGAIRVHGARIAMLSSVLKSRRAIQVNIEIMRAFVRLRQMLASNAQLARKLTELERKYDAQFKVVFDAIRQLMTPPEPNKRKIGFLVKERAPGYGRA